MNFPVTVVFVSTLSYCLKVLLFEPSRWSKVIQTDAVCKIRWKLLCDNECILNLAWTICECLHCWFWLSLNIHTNILIKQSKERKIKKRQEIRNVMCFVYYALCLMQYFKKRRFFWHMVCEKNKTRNIILHMSNFPVHLIGFPQHVMKVSGKLHTQWEEETVGISCFSPRDLSEKLHHIINHFLLSLATEWQLIFKLF